MPGSIGNFDMLPVTHEPLVGVRHQGSCGRRGQVEGPVELVGGNRPSPLNNGVEMTTSICAMASVYGVGIRGC